MRRAALVKWVERVEANKLFEQPLVLTELLSPRTFLNALRQETARATGTPTSLPFYFKKCQISFVCYPIFFV